MLPPVYKKRYEQWVESPRYFQDKKVDGCGSARGDHRDIGLDVAPATVTRGVPCGRTQVSAARLQHGAGTWARRCCRCGMHPWIHGYSGGVLV